MEKPKVLVADDDFDIRELLRFLLEIEGYEVVTAGNGFEALGAAVAEQPDLVVLDVMMPGENGYLVARGIRENTRRDEACMPRIPIVLLTARDLRGDPERERAFLEFSGADEVVYKPFDGAHVISRINEMVAGRPLRAAVENSPPLRLKEVELESLYRRPAASPYSVTAADWNPSEMWLS